jgi:acetyl-CoA carboxylase carboxyl transferase subunit alpha
MKMLNRHWLDFEKKKIEGIEKKIDEIRDPSAGPPPKRNGELGRYEKKAKVLIKEVYAKLSPWQVMQVARHPGRPYTLDYIDSIFDDFVELHGDRCYRDDPALVTGLARLDGEAVVVIGHQKGRNLKERNYRNFGMPNPEGYRKALRVMELAERFGRPVFTFIDTPGAYPGIGAEERGQSEAIAANLMRMSTLRVPIIATVIGEGGSGGALAVGVADKVLMLEFATYSVISPEGCAAILWKDGSKASIAAKALCLDSAELLKLGVIDKVVKEPVGAAHRDPKAASKFLKTALISALKVLKAMPIDDLVENRYKKFRNIGIFRERK